jgi:hypothetical protein
VATKAGTARDDAADSGSTGFSLIGVSISEEEVEEEEEDIEP